MVVYAAPPRGFIIVAQAIGLGRSSYVLALKGQLSSPLSVQARKVGPVLKMNLDFS
jgi:hypothetical protein